MLLLCCDGIFCGMVQMRQEVQATMSDLLRDTVFGQVVRLLSKNNLFKFPDEADPNLWRQCIREDIAATSSSSKENIDLAQSSANATPEVIIDSAREEKFDITQTDPSQEKLERVVLVHWYGPDDEEV
jgi:MFS transporter, DHA1 family, multidrug resistance protein